MLFRSAFENRLAEMLGDPSRRTPEELRRDFEGVREETPPDTATTSETTPQQG